MHATLSCGVVEVQHPVELEDCSDDCAMWIPNAFTPDGDGHNDQWTWESECTPNEISVMIFDRWGELIYRSEESAATWDGTYNGKPSQVGVYAYRVGYRLPYQEKQWTTGSITLVR